MRVIQVGPEGIHLSNFCKSIHDHIGDFGYIGETDFEIHGASTHAIAAFRGLDLFSWFKSLRLIYNYLKKERPNLIHIHQINRLAFFVTFIATKLSIPIVSTAWGSDVLLVPQKSFLHKFITRFVLKNSLVITCDSLQMKSVIQELTSSNQEIHCLQYGINPVKAEVKQKLVYSNRLHKPLYRIDLIIRLFADFYQNHKDWKLIIGAEGESTNELKLLAEQLLPPSAYEFVGWLNAELNAHWYAKSSVYVSLPESDGTSVSLLEAMSADCIPIVPNLAVSHEWIESGKNGIVYKEDSNPFTEALSIDKTICHQINQRVIAERALKSTTSKMFYSIYKSIVK